MRMRKHSLGAGRARPAAVALPIAALVVVSLVPGVLAASTTVNLDQWASTDLAWQNGNLNGNNSRYPEGGVVPFRLAMEGLSPGAHEIRLNYDFTAGGHKAYDFLATWNVTNGGGAICSASGGAISSMCPALPAAKTWPFPSDPFVTDGLSVFGAQTYAGMARRLTIWGGTITGITAPVHSGSPAGNSSVEMRVSFTTTGGAVLLAWGGHLAQSSYWDAMLGAAPDGAKMVSGAPWHVRTLGLDGSGARNQDRSIQPSAIVGALPPGGPTATFPPVIPPLGPFDPDDPADPVPTQPATSTQVAPVARVGGSVPSLLAVVGGVFVCAVAAIAWQSRRRH